MYRVPKSRIRANNNEGLENRGRREGYSISGVDGKNASSFYDRLRTRLLRVRRADVSKPRRTREHPRFVHDFIVHRDSVFMVVHAYAPSGCAHNAHVVWFARFNGIPREIMRKGT